MYLELRQYKNDWIAWRNLAHLDWPWALALIWTWLVTSFLDWPCLLDFALLDLALIGLTLIGLSSIGLSSIGLALIGLALIGLATFGLASLASPCNFARPYQVDHACLFCLPLLALPCWICHVWLCFVSFALLFFPSWPWTVGLTLSGLVARLY